MLSYHKKLIASIIARIQNINKSNKPRNHNQKLCLKSFTTIFDKDVLLYWVPNAFTPDGDEFNQVFKPIFTSGFDPYDYTLLIFDRWGELIFESHNHEVGWDGTYRGNLVQDGVYVWKLEFKETMTDKRHNKYGHVTILR